MVLKRSVLEVSSLAAAAGVLVAAGCGLFSPREGALSFNHAVHAEKGLECDSCHEDYESEPGAGMPTYETCLTCHGPGEGEPKAYEAEIQKHPPEERIVSRALLSADINFSHATHAEKEVPCADCHGDVAKTTRPSAVRNPGAEECASCHRSKGLADDCAVCHETIRKDVRPPSHGGAAWMKIHGQDPADGYASRGHEENCSLCHTQASCDACHRVEKPQDHTEFFRIQGHGSFASMERDRCQACHQEPFCVRCHQETAPRSHASASWGGSQSNHCLYCHADVKDSGCYVCHRATPSHGAATAIPGPPHPPPTANCYDCHLRPPHADSGQPCTVCHRR